MKRMLFYLLCALLLASMTACGQTPLSSSTEPVQTEVLSLDRKSTRLNSSHWS